MPYDERSINELYESAEITPMGIQLEVNAEIFTTIYNLLSNMRSEEGIQQEDEKTPSPFMAENGSRHGQGGTPQRSWDFYGKTD